MPEETMRFKDELEGGIKYEIHTSSGFSGRSEIAIIVEEKVVSVITVEVKRSGNVYCRPARLKTILIKKDKEELSGPSSLDLDDVLGQDKDEDTAPSNE